MTTLNTEADTTAATTATSDKPKYKGKIGAQILHEMLVGPHKVEYMFGYPGGAILPMFDQLYKTPAKFILNRHEQASGHCADGYARATGKPGVCIVTSGPGRYQHRYPAGDRAARQHSDGDLQRTGGDEIHRQRCVSGSRCHRNHPAVYEVELSDQRCSRSSASG